MDHKRNHQTRPTNKGQGSGYTPKLRNRHYTGDGNLTDTHHLARPEQTRNEIHMQYGAAEATCSTNSSSTLFLTRPAPQTGKLLGKYTNYNQTQINITTEQVHAAIKNSKKNNSTGPDNINIKHLKTLAKTDYSTSRSYTTLQSATIKYLMFGNWQTSYRSPTQTKTSTLRRHTGRYPFYL